MNTVIDLSKPIYQPIKKAAELTGLSQYFLRQLLKEGKLPHTKTGVKVLVNLPALLDSLEEKSSSEVVL